MCWGESCPWCRGCSWMDLVQPLGQSCPEDVRAVCASPTSLCSCCVQVPRSPRAPRLCRGHHPAHCWESAALSQQPESRAAGAGWLGQSRAACQSPASSAGALLSVGGSLSAGLPWSHPELDVSPSETSSVSHWADPAAARADPAVAGRGWGHSRREGGRHETPPLLGVHPEGVRVEACWASPSLTEGVWCVPCLCPASSCLLAQPCATGCCPGAGASPWCTSLLATCRAVAPVLRDGMGSRHLMFG